jgi:hypothetical protein
MIDVQRFSFPSMLLNKATLHRGEYFKKLLALINGTGVAQSAYLLPTGRNVRGSYHGWGGGDLPHQFSPALGPTWPPIQGVTDFFLREKRLGRGVDHPPSSGIEIKNRQC